MIEVIFETAKFKKKRIGTSSDPPNPLRIKRLSRARTEKARKTCLTDPSWIFDNLRDVFGSARRRMSDSSRIEWTDATWNPVRGCTKISPGCAHCYACTFAERFRDVPGHPYEQGFDLRLVPEKLTQPLLWRASKMIFVNSMSDLFHEGVPDDYIESVARVMVAANWHTFQILTKRSERLRDLLNTRLNFAARQSHIWWGVSVENKKHGLPRIDHLRRSPALNRFLSVEPLLEALGIINLDRINWVIVGGESGLKARPMELEWAREIQQQCEDSNVAFFLKQLGGCKGKRGGDEAILDGKMWRQFPHNY